MSSISHAPALQAQDLAVGYRSRRGRRAVLERVNVAVHPGELICLLGPNGIGKSTLLRTLARMQPPLWGTVALGGERLDALSASALARRLGVVLTDRVGVEALSVWRVVALGRYPHSGWLGKLDANDRAVVDRAIDAVGARHLAERDVSQLSDGERQRVMVARALAQEPLLLLLDEPTAFLDVPSRVELFALLRRLTRTQAPAARAGSPAAFDGRCIPPLGVARRSTRTARTQSGAVERKPRGNAALHIPDILPPRAWIGGRLARLGATRHFQHGPLAAVISTHDLELALRTADVIWLVEPGGELISGAPEDVMLSGAVARAFEGRQVRFHVEDRNFRWLTGERGSAAVRGDGLPAVMARAVLEREGYAIVADATSPETLVVAVGESGWHLSSDAADHSGDTFRALATCLRALASTIEETE